MCLGACMQLTYLVGPDVCSLVLSRRMAIQSWEQDFLPKWVCPVGESAFALTVERKGKCKTIK